MKKFVEKEPNELEPTNLPATQAPARGRQSPVGQGPHHAGVMRRPCARAADWPNQALPIAEHGVDRVRARGAGVRGERLGI